MKLDCSFNIAVGTEASLNGSWNTGITVTSIQDAPGEYTLNAASAPLLISIDIIPDEIKQVLIQSGVQFS